MMRALACDGIPPKQRALQRIKELRLEGHGTPAIARILNEEGFTGRNGGKWHVTSVRRALVELKMSTQGPPVVRR